MNNVEKRKFTPALGVQCLTPFYDFAIAWLTRETTWREKLVNGIAPKRGERILDVGCGTGTLALQLKAMEPEVGLIGIDPDPEVLRRAASKAAAQALVVEWEEGFLSDDFVETVRPLSKIVSSLVFHQTPEAEKHRMHDCIYRALEPGGYFFIADYGEQRSRLMRWLFRLTVQMLDGTENTARNAQGRLPELMVDAGFQNVEELDFVPTLTGSISIYRGQKPMKATLNGNCQKGAPGSFGQSCKGA